MDKIRENILDGLEQLARIAGDDSELDAEKFSLDIQRVANMGQHPIAKQHDQS